MTAAFWVAGALWIRDSLAGAAVLTGLLSAVALRRPAASPAERDVAWQALGIALAALAVAGAGPWLVLRITP
jgi:hypothetical protein